MLPVRGETQQQLLNALKRQPRGMSVDDLARELTITRTAVRQHLAVLGRDGLAVRTASVQSGGRPAHLYGLSSKAQETFPRQYSWFSDVLLKAVRAKLGDQALAETLRAMGAVAAGPAPVEAMPLEQCVSVLVTKMTELGYDAKMSADNPTEITAHNCVFHQLAVSNPEVCEFDLGLIERATGAKPNHVECIARGGNACRFKLMK